MRSVWSNRYQRSSSSRQCCTDPPCCSEACWITDELQLSHGQSPTKIASEGLGFPYRWDITKRIMNLLVGRRLRTFELRVVLRFGRGCAKTIGTPRINRPTVEWVSQECWLPFAYIQPGGVICPRHLCSVLNLRLRI